MLKLKWFILFIIINFGALYLGSLLMNNGPQTQWYTNLNQAPWTPPGWMFGVAWTTIMFFFSIYMVLLVSKLSFIKIVWLFSFQLFLNIIWNYIFFNRQMLQTGLLVIIALTLVVAYFLFKYFNILKLKSLLIAPYFIWLLIATSLNLYIVLYN